MTIAKVSTIQATSAIAQDVYRPRAWLPVLMYHRVSPGPKDRDPLDLVISVADFDAQMRFLKAHGYRAITVEEYADMVVQGARLTGREVLITFDDGYEDTYTHALPLLERYRFRATVFLVSGQIGGTNEWDHGKQPEARLLDAAQVREMQARGVSFGSHSVTHPYMALLPRDRAKRELVESRVALEDLLGQPVRTFCFPYGNADRIVREMAREAGYVAACGIEQREHTLYNISRINAAGCGGAGLRWMWRVSGASHFLRRNIPVRGIRDAFRRMRRRAAPAEDVAHDARGPDG